MVYLVFRSTVPPRTVIHDVELKRRSLNGKDMVIYQMLRSIGHYAANSKYPYAIYAIYYVPRYAYHT